MIIRYGPRRVAVSTEDVSARFEPVGWLEDARAAEATRGDVGTVRALVEILLLTGGLAPRALIGGEFTPSAGSATEFRVAFSAPLAVGEPQTCASRLWRPLVPGMPAEFADATLAGLLRVSCFTRLPAGILQVDRAGHDEVESSTMAFELAGGVLMCVLTAMAFGEDVGSEVTKLARSW